MKKLKSIFYLRSRRGKEGKENESAVPVKHYTYMIKTGGVIKHANIIASDLLAADSLVKTQYPHCERSFLWEYIRSTPDCFEDKQRMA